MPLLPSDITAYVLAGGKSTRMGEDKGWMVLNGQPLIIHVTSPLKTLFSSVCIVSEDKSYDALKLRRIEDHTPHLGPAGGIFAALRDCKTTKALICTCDMPFIDSDFLRKMISKTAEEEILLPCSPKEWHPFPAIYSPSIAKPWAKEMEKGRYALKHMLKTFQVNELHLQDKHSVKSSTFFNINTPEDLVQAEALIKL